MADYSSLGVFGGYYGQQQAATETAMLKALAPIQVEQAQTNLQETKIGLQQKTFDLLNAETLYARQQRMLQQLETQQGSTSSAGPQAQANTEAERQANVMFRQADIERANGFFKEADETSSKASGILENNSKIQTRTANMQIKMYTDVRNMLDAVHNERDWDNLRTMFPNMYPDVARMPAVQQILQRPYPGPAAVKAIADTLGSQKERAQTAAALADAAARTAAAKKDETWVRDYEPALRKEAEARAEHLGKAGGNALKVPSSDITAMQKLITDIYPNADKDRAYNLARGLAQDAAILQARGMSKEEAQNQAIRQAGRAYFANVEGMINVPGTSPDKPLSLPSDGDVSKMKDGHYYLTPKDGLRVWDAKAQGLVAPSVRALEDEQETLPVGDDDKDEDHE